MSLRDRVRSELTAALEACRAAGLFSGELPEVALERPKRPEHGDLATNVALTLAKRAGKPPRAVAEALASALRASTLLTGVEIAGPGFLNLRIAPAELVGVVTQIRRAGRDYGRSAPRGGPRILLEFVSANPTGPVHLAHGRHAALGDALGRLLAFAGYDLAREFYVNDWGNQTRNLARSMWARYMEARGKAVPFPEDGYHGDYIRDAAKALADEVGDRYEAEREPADLDAIRDWALARFLAWIKATLDRFEVGFDRFESEAELHRSGKVRALLSALIAGGHTYEKDGARWLKAIELAGDERDRVIEKSDGSLPYVCADIAYHLDKLERGFGRVIDIWGADHHGHIPGIRAGLRAAGRDPAAFEVLLVQMVKLLRGGEEIKMSKRAGQLITLDEILDEVGKDATRWYFLSRRHDASIDFDLELAKKQTFDNPVYYVQYGHARCCAILRRAFQLEPSLEGRMAGPADLGKLALDDELAIVRRMADFPEDVADAARALEPHRMVFFAYELAQSFQSYFTRLQKVHGDTILPQERQRTGDWRATWDWDKTLARLQWVDAIRTTLANALAIVGISAPDRMDPPASAEGTPEET